MLHRPIGTPTAAPPAIRRWTTRRFLLAIAALWLVAAAILAGLRAHAIADRAYADPDDQMRLLEVSDWLSGQSFWDVSQHRINQPFGGPMHWSRIVDAPIAAIELLLRPLTGAAVAEVAAAVVVPLLTLAVLMALVGLVARRMADVPTGLLAAAITPTALATMIQFQPLRVDHHGWEVMCAFAGLAASLSDRRRHAGALAGTAIAIGLQISLELLPFAAALGGVIAVRWVLDPTPVAARRLAGFAGALAIVEALLFVALHPPSDWVVYCDAISLPHLLALAIVAIGVPACLIAAPRSIAMRGAALAAVAVVAALAFRAVPPHCGLDPFSALSPIVKSMWLVDVLEGQPVWRSGWAVALTLCGFPLVGLGCAAAAIRATSGERRASWIAYVALLLAATLVGVFVLRANSLSNAIALVPAAWAAVILVRRVQRSAIMPVRVLGSTAALVALSPWAPAVLVAALPLGGGDAKPVVAPAKACGTPSTLAALESLPPARILAPLDIGPKLLLDTHHAVLATSHHRNQAAMADVLRAMIGNDAQARDVVRRHGLGYVLVCPELNEVASYRRKAPGGFTARLLRGDTPAWLEPVRLPGTRVPLWRVVPAQPPAGSPSSRSAGGSVPAPEHISRSAVLSPSS